MWVCLNDGFVSIVEDPNDPSKVFVRGRRRSCVEAFLGTQYQITETLHRDYRFRAHIDKFDLSKHLAQCADKIDYTNFKDSVEDRPLKQFYTEVWVSGVDNLDPKWQFRQQSYYR